MRLKLSYFLYDFECQKTEINFTFLCFVLKFSINYRYVLKLGLFLCRVYAEIKSTTLAGHSEWFWCQVLVYKSNHHSHSHSPQITKYMLLSHLLSLFVSPQMLMKQWLNYICTLADEKVKPTMYYILYFSHYFWNIYILMVVYNFLEKGPRF